MNDGTMKPRLSGRGAVTDERDRIAAEYGDEWDRLRAENGRLKNLLSEWNAEITRLRRQNRRLRRKLRRERGSWENRQLLEILAHVFPGAKGEDIALWIVYARNHAKWAFPEAENTEGPL